MVKISRFDIRTVNVGDILYESYATTVEIEVMSQPEIDKWGDRWSFTGRTYRGDVYFSGSILNTVYNPKLSKTINYYGKVFYLDGRIEDAFGVTV